MSRQIRKLSALTRRFGWKCASKAAVFWALRRTFGYRSATIYCLNLDELQGSSRCEEFEWSYKNAAEIAPELLAGGGYNLPALEHLIALGNLCFIGTANGTQCYLSLVSKTGFVIPERVRVTFSRSTHAYVGNCVTLDEYRGMGIYPCGLEHLGLNLYSDGRNRLYLFVERDNFASIRGVLKVGFYPIATCSVYRWGRLFRRRWRVLSRGPIDGWKVELGSF